MPQPLLEVTNLRIAVNDQDAAVRGDRPPPRLDPTYVTGEGGVEDWQAGMPLPVGWVEVIPGISYGVDAGEVLALIGESASGKSLALLGAFALLSGGARTLGGTVTYDGNTFHPAGSPQMPEDKGKRRRVAKRRKSLAGTVMAEYEPGWAERVGMEVGFLFQDPIAAWTPTQVIGEQAGEALGIHTDLSVEEIEERVFDALGEVQLPKSNRLFGAFAIDVSRGQGQRAMLAAALVKAPRLLIADEPLTGLDAPVAAAILDLIRDMQRKRGMGMILVTHDLATVAGIADRVAVVYGGRIIEEGPVREVFHAPKHPYTSGLLGSIPGTGKRLRPIEGEAPRLTDVPPGRCTFVNRCQFATGQCFASEPSLETIGPSQVACHHASLLDLPGVGE